MKIFTRFALSILIVVLLIGIATAASITVTAPNGGGNWEQGSTQTIRWSYTGSCGSYVKIELLKGTTVSRVISSSASVGCGGSGSKSWTVPYNQVLGADYKIRVTSTSNPSLFDTSNANFAIIAGPPLIVVSPNGGENWQRGSTHTIKWGYSGNPGSYVKIELLKGTTVSRVISSSASVGPGGSGSKSWTVPSTQTVGTNYKIRISSISNPSLVDTSNANFAIGSASGDNSLNPFD